jgi:hypothetical protein
MRKLILASVILAAGCSASTIDEPIPLDRSNGSPGFRMFGAVNYTQSVAEARQVVQRKMDDACGGPARLTHFDPTPDASGPIDMVDFEATATCQP